MGEFKTRHRCERNKKRRDSKGAADSQTKRQIDRWKNQTKRDVDFVCVWVKISIVCASMILMGKLICSSGFLSFGTASLRRVDDPCCPIIGWLLIIFLYLSRERDSATRFVRRLVGWSVGRSRFTFFYDLIFLASLRLPKWSSDLKYGPCPPARDFDSRVSGLVL